jgi:uncharacterized membrane protein
MLGWGMFNVVEGTVDHQLLMLHHVRPGRTSRSNDLAFLAWGVVMIAMDWWLSRASGHSTRGSELDADPRHSRAAPESSEGSNG